MDTKHIIITTLFLALIAVPAAVSAHGETTDATDSGTMMGPMMMHTDDVSNETHQQMQEYMHDLQSGDLSNADAQQMAELMRENHDAFSQGTWDTSMMGGQWTPMGGMMGMSGLWGVWGWLIAVCTLVWLVVGVLLAALLIKKLRQ